MKYISFIGSFIITAFLFFSFVFVAGCGKTEDMSKIPVTTSSEEAKAEFLEGRDLFEKLRQQESLQHFENAIAIDKDFAIAYYYHSIANPTAKGFFEDLEKMTALTDKTSEGEKLIILALKAGVDGNQKIQEEHLKKLVELYPEDVRALNQLGQFYFGQQKYQLAVDQLQKATELDPEYSGSYNMLGYSHRNLGNFSEAEEAFIKYIELIPDDPNPYDSYAELLMKEGRYEESIEQYKKALSINPDFAASYLGIANNYTLMKKYDEAREQCQVLYDRAKNDGQKRNALLAKTISYVDEGNTDLALEEMQKRYELADMINDAGAMTFDLNIMGNILFEAGRYDKAAEKYNKSLVTALNSNLPEEVKENTKRLALYNDGRISLMKGDIDAAKLNATHFGESATKANNTFQKWLSHELNGMIAMQENDFVKAKEEFEQANQQNPKTHYMLALASERIGNKEEAKIQYEISKNFNALTSLNQAFVRNKAEEMLARL